MGNSLQEQLLKKGLINKKKANALKHQSRQKTKSANKDQASAQKAVEQARQAQQARDRELNLQRKIQAEKKAIAAQIVQLVERYRLDRKTAELEFNFSDKNIVKKILVTPQFAKEISRGRLCIVRFGESYEVIPRPIADKIRERDADAIVVYNEDAQATIASDSNDSWYAQFEIPDDLVW